MKNVLNDEEVLIELTRLNENSSLTWELKKEKLFTSIKFNSFIEAFGFLTQVALCSEKLNHHPEIYNSYAKVDLSLTTHEVGSLTSLDFKLASDISKFL
ncbi:4a-hydroxytetrahydrobiopterin dehydratase [Vibrio ishigakensis]|uniref:4a-hydroxytetrahydrobiopterin dehydratase n=1 Tax=Vibrio ishigakensis TaxID=1481914 RepID=UPI0021C382B4|nr:4a-hydroxytetrahydrobiopterin dehydratase [Vibrio ishigakensis]